MEDKLITNIKSDWVDGNLVFSDNEGDVALKIDAVNKQLNTSYQLTGGSLNPKVAFVAAADIDEGELVYISGWNATLGLPVMNLADADAANPAKCAEFICDADVASGAVGYAVGEKLISGIDTSASSAVGAPVYLGTTAGGWSLSAPTDGGACIQRVGVVTVDHATTGAIMFYPFYSKAVTVNTIA